MIKHRVNAHAASCAYYFLVSFVPVLVIAGWGITALADRFGFMHLELLENIRLYSQIQSLSSFMGIAAPPVSFKALGVLGVIYVGWSASSLIKAIHEIFAAIFPAKTKSKGIITMITVNFMIPLLMITAIIVSLLSAVITHIFRWLLVDMTHLINRSIPVSILTPVLAMLVVALVMYACFMLLAQGKPKKIPAIAGSLLFAIYFMLIQHGFSIIMVKLIAVYSRYGTMGSLLLILFWAFMIFYGMFIAAEYVRVIDNFGDINYIQYIYVNLKNRPSLLEKIMMLKLHFGDSYLTHFFNGEKRVYDGAAIALFKVKSGEITASCNGQKLPSLQTGEIYNQIGVRPLTVEFTALSDSKALIVPDNDVKELLSRHPDVWTTISAGEAIGVSNK
jgi:uncharacterized BrkB/YihY/UPF0761 family membrane protein